VAERQRILGLGESRLQELRAAQHSIQLVAGSVGLLRQVGPETEELLPLVVDRSGPAHAYLLNLRVEER
jgi:hypothetical protein